MNMISCYIVDDEYHAIETLKALVLQSPFLTLIGYSDNPVMALNEVQTLHPDIIFLDVEMSEMSGLQFIDLVTTSLVIFTTSHAIYAIDAYEKRVFDYLLKPITQERFLKCIFNVRKDFIQKGANEKGEQRYFFIKTDLRGKFDKVEIADILYIEADSNFVHLHLISGPRIAYLMIGEVLDYLPSAHFTRIHKSLVINDKAVQTIEATRVTLINNKTLDIGRSYKDDFHKKMNPLIFKSKRDR